MAMGIIGENMPRQRLITKTFLNFNTFECATWYLLRAVYSFTAHQTTNYYYYHYCCYDCTAVHCLQSTHRTHRHIQSSREWEKPRHNWIRCNRTSRRVALPPSTRYNKQFHMTCVISCCCRRCVFAQTIYGWLADLACEWASERRKIQ